MLEQITVRGFKSLACVERLDLPKLSVLFGPNAVGKSNFLDAIQVLSGLGTSRTLAEALQRPIRGRAIEAFAFPSGGLPELLGRNKAQFEIGAHVRAGEVRLDYRITIAIHPHSGNISLANEYLTRLQANQDKARGSPVIEKENRDLLIRSRTRGRPIEEEVGLNHSIVSGPRWSGKRYEYLELCRNELSGWWTYYLDPRNAMRQESSPAAVPDIGALGQDIAPFLYRLRAEREKHFQAVKRTLRQLIPSVEDISVELDKRRGTLDIMIRQNGVDYSSRIVSEGTLRVLALCAIAVNPWSGPLVAFEEPENGVHPKRIERIAELLTCMTLDQNRQLIVTTHSPRFCAAMIGKAKEQPGQVGLFHVRQGERGTELERFDISGPLFQEAELREALSDRGDEDVFEGLILRGILDE